MSNEASIYKKTWKVTVSMKNGTVFEQEIVKESPYECYTDIDKLDDRSTTFEIKDSNGSFINVRTSEVVGISAELIAENVFECNKGTKE